MKEFPDEKYSSKEQNPLANHSIIPLDNYRSHQPEKKSIKSKIDDRVSVSGHSLYGDKTTTQQLTGKKAVAKKVENKTKTIITPTTKKQVPSAQTGLIKKHSMLNQAGQATKQNYGYQAQSVRAKQSDQQSENKSVLNVYNLDSVR